ncbi:MAG: sulfatase [Bacteroidia bacterium]|nr:sulfatase [Bacteroidia bacterium]
MKHFIYCALLAFLVGCGGNSSEMATDETKASPVKKPNFVIIFCDDLGYGDLGVYGNTEIKTPHLDAMAGQGLKLNSLYSISPVCSPSRAGLMTGRYPIRMGIHGVFFPESWTGMDTSEVTLAESLKEIGYATGIVGKWHLGHHHQYLPLQNGFDEYFGIPYSNDMEAVVYLEGNKVVDEAVDQRLTTRTYTEKALDFIERKKDQPFFLYLAHAMPHVPIYASDQFAGKSPRGLYGDVVEEIDLSTGQILKKLEEEGLAENTLVIFTSDNGPWLPFGPDGGSAGILREGKQYTFEGGMRVPGLLQWKGRIKPGQVSDEVVTMLDWFPTLGQLAGAKILSDRPIDGQDISSFLREQKPWENESWPTI